MITWRDRFHAFMRNCRRDPAAAWVELALLAGIAALILVLCSCAKERMPTIGGPPGTNAPAQSETAGQKVARLEGELAQAKSEHEEERLAPLRTSLAWVDGIALLGMLLGVGLAIAAMFWGLGFGWKIPAGGALACGGILAVSLATAWALAHVVWIIGGVVALAIAAIGWAVMRHLSLVGAARTAWGLVPAHVTAPAFVEDLMAKITTTKDPNV